MDISKYQEVLGHPQLWLTELQRRWLRPRSLLSRTAYAALYVINRISIRILFRVAVDGYQHLPASGPFIVTPNHTSPLDPPLLAFALPLAMLQNTYWAGKQSTVLRNRRRRLMSWLTRVIPISDDRTSLAAAVIILEHGHHLVWFPEGERSIDGQLQKFKPGIATLLTRCDVPVVPVLIQGAHDAFPRRGCWPRFRAKIIVRIGPAVTAQQLGLTSSSAADINHVVVTLQQRVADLGCIP